LVTLRLRDEFETKNSGRNFLKIPFSNRAGVKQRVNVAIITRSSLSNEQNITLSLFTWRRMLPHVVAQGL